MIAKNARIRPVMSALMRSTEAVSKRQRHSNTVLFAVKLVIANFALISGESEEPKWMRYPKAHCLSKP